ncbi:MAG: rhodanese-like domain-containing protein [Desulfocapsa sp.]|nr:rhodanese-like domain-containing protein [Desulfocapsa sp.]
MKPFWIITLSLVCLLNVAAIFEKFNYLEQDQFKQWLESDKPMVIVDIQDKASFAAHHFLGSIETNAFPVKTDAERKLIDPAVTAYKASGNDVVVICPRGGGGAKRCYSYLKSQGVPEAKLTILKNGIDNWPHRDMLTNK